jgi:hypothetical protein
MEGQIGTLIQNEEQIGGFYNWSTDLLLDRTKGKDGTDYQFQRLKLVSNEVWLFKHPVKPEMVVCLYQLIDDRLALVMKKETTINLPKLPLNVKYLWPLEAVWMR